MKTLHLSIALLVIAAVLWGCESPKNVEIDVQAPPTARKGDEFVITATVRNTALKPQTLVSLDVGDKYLNGIAILKTDPNHKEATHVPIDNTMSYVFGLPLKPGEGRRILLYAKAVKTGDHNAEIDFCINSDTSFLSKNVRTIVE
jgi:hypothetical protein